ncbi:LOW QUALITY PROTEIN: sterile alpha motif domain-containing protein 9-like [Aplochiton taeniatus]
MRQISHAVRMRQISHAVRMRQISHAVRMRQISHADNVDFKYVQNTVLQPESGIKNVMVPCHEYKSLVNAVKFDRTRLQIKFASEVIRFGSGCMNVRTNGTIHFGVLDSKNTGWNNGEIMGIPVKEKDLFVDALDYIEKSFSASQCQDARQCIRPPRFIEVVDRDQKQKNWVIEVDVVPMAKTVKGKVYEVRIPTFCEKSNKPKFDVNTIFQRVGASTASISNDNKVYFILGIPERDSRREEAESSQNLSEIQEDLGRKLSIRLTSGKTYIDDSLWYIIVTNKCDGDNLKNINFLLHMNIFCVFDFDPDSMTLGFCKQYLEHHAANPYFLHDYTNESRLSTTDFIKKLQLFELASWIFCNGRSDYLGGEKPCDEKNWIKTKKKQLNSGISRICNEILTKGSFQVLFLLMSEVEQPLVETFHGFFAEMNGHEDITVISESKEHYNKWSSLAQTSCSLETLHEISIVGLQMSHLDATLQSIQLPVTKAIRHLPVFKKALCVLKTVDEERMLSLEILSVDQCSADVIDQETVDNTERYFYRGGKISWMNFWMADESLCEGIVQRDAYMEATTILNNLLQGNAPKRSVARLSIYHQPGSGGSSVARQILWNRRKDLRCAVVKHSHSVTSVCEHAVRLREYEEKDRNSCLPVLLLLEDFDVEFLNELRHELANAVSTMTINPSTLCFILLGCERCHDPRTMCVALPLQTVAVTLKLSVKEKRQFSRKGEKLELKYEPKFILTFVLMSNEFEEQYLTDFVGNLLKDIDHSSVVTRLIRYVALLNCYVQNSFVSLSHCEVFLGLGTQIKGHIHNFKSSLSKQAKLVFIARKETTTHIKSIRIIHDLVAKEILHQLSGSQPQSAIAMDLLQENVLFDHRFGRDEYNKFIRDLFMRRCKRSRGDDTDSSFSPLIEHVCNEEGNFTKAKDLLTAAYTCFGNDPFFAQQLARLCYTNELLDDAVHWVEVAKSDLPYDSFILDTEGQVYKKWFNVMFEKLHKDNLMPENVTEMIGIALKAIEAFRASQKASKSESNSMNNSGFFGEVDVGCRLLNLISSVSVFSNQDGHSELLRYLVSEHVPKAVKEPWQNVHSRLKGLQKSIFDALEWISEDLRYFQTDKSDEGEDHRIKEPQQEGDPRKWLTRKISVYARVFCDARLHSANQEPKSDSTDALTPLTRRMTRRMTIYHLGGGNVTTILSLLSDKNTQRSSQKLEKIIDMYSEDSQREKLDQIDLVNYIFCQIALRCAFPCSPKLVTLEELQEISMRLYKERNHTSPASAFFLLSLLFWPEKPELSQKENKILTSAIDRLQNLYDLKIKNVPQRKKRIYTDFFLGQGVDRIVHRSKIEKYIKGTLSERRLKWLSGEVWLTTEVTHLLKRVQGWTENGNLFVQGTCKDIKIKVIPLYSASLPNGNENVTFFLGFTYNGPVAFDIRILRL